MTEPDGCQSRACVRLLLSLWMAVPLASLAPITLPRQLSFPQQHSPDIEAEPVALSLSLLTAAATSAVAVACVSLGAASISLPHLCLSLFLGYQASAAQSHFRQVTRSSTRRWAKFKKGAVEVDFLIIRGTALSQIFFAVQC